MSTRSLIVTKTDDDKYRGIYVHNDGYPEYNGKILQEHYTCKEKIDALINLGNLSSLAPSIEKPEGHTFDNRVDGYCVFYDRDRGEEGQEPFTKFSIDAVLNYDCGQEYVYIWNGSKWIVYWYQNGVSSRTPTKGRDLHEVLESFSFEA